MNKDFPDKSSQEPSLKHRDASCSLIKMRSSYVSFLGESSDEQESGLAKHNFYRAKHGSPDLILSDELNEQVFFRYDISVLMDMIMHK